MEHSFMHSKSASASSVFSFKSAAAAASWNAKEDEEEEVGYDDDDDDGEEEEEDDEDVDESGDEEEGVKGGKEEIELAAEETRAKKKRMYLGGGGSGGSIGKKVSSTGVAAGGRGGGGGGGGRGLVVVAQTPLPPGCQVDECVADLTDSKRYHQRHKVCEYHSKAKVVILAGIRQRFCQQCSRFHDVSEFDDAKRSCRRRLAGHNERRRKQFSESRGERSASAGRRVSDSVTQMDKKQCRQVDERQRTKISLSKNTQNFHIH